MQESDQSRAPLPAGLYVVATPIGNLGDISARALATLGQAQLIAAEDTRVTAKLLARFQLRTPMIAYHDHNAERVRPELLRRAQTEAIVLVSDAGTPLISDPGYKLVREAAAQGLSVVPIPGPSALTTALSVAGLPTDRVLFLGFLPVKTKARRDAFAEVAHVKATLVLFESAQRLAACLADALAALGPRDAAVARELTKTFEEVRRGTTQALAAHYAEAGPPKGEIVIVIGPPAAAAKPQIADADPLLVKALAAHSLREAVDAVADATGLPRREVYARALAFKDKP
jgi:16S rRNA (cytidine1402-2'-O)-methyltransferase